VTLREGDTGSYAFRLVTRKARKFDAKLGDKITGKLDTAGRVDVYIVDTADARRIRIGNGSPCQDISVGYSDDVAKPSTLTPALVCWDHRSADLESNHRVAIEVWSDAGKPGDYSFTVDPAD
jgi:hypothetical protein